MLKMLIKAVKDEYPNYYGKRKKKQKIGNTYIIYNNFSNDNEVCIGSGLTSDIINIKYYINISYRVRNLELIDENSKGFILKTGNKIFTAVKKNKLKDGI